MRRTLSLCLLLATFAPFFGECKFDYCKKMCWDGGPQDGCLCKKTRMCETYEFGNWTHFRWLMLDVHNYIRNELALGKFRKYGFPKAKNMIALTYDYDLEYTARCHAKQCYVEHNDCASTEKFPDTGQTIVRVLNRFFGHIQTNEPDERFRRLVAPFRSSKEAEALKQKMRGMFKNDFDKEDVHNLINCFYYEYDIARLTQLIWAATTHVGCWQTEGKMSEYVSVNDPTPVLVRETGMITCNYGPAGNRENKTIYEQGNRTGDACPNGTAVDRGSKLYPGLCMPSTPLLPPPPFPKRKYGYDDPPNGAHGNDVVDYPVILTRILVSMTINFVGLLPVI